MNKVEWQRLQELFQAAVDLPATEREQLLDNVPDVELRRQVQSLLRLDGEESHEWTNALSHALLADEFAPGTRIGPYEVVRLLGRGGMGAVYLVQRSDGEFVKQAALKVIRLSDRTPEVLQRFKTERQILATLDHPNVARLLDGGSIDEDKPFVLMEYVAGVPLDQYCNEHELDLRQRIALFRAVCDAVQHAHQKLIIHRDLKPSNILVTAEGQVKLLDFGIGKLLDTSSVLHTVAMTRAAERLMTPEYASPEQIRGEYISTATDVYSLGVILYELLTGKRPFDAPTATLASEPPPPAVPRDLANIIAVAMRKEPERRYATVAQLSEDLRRWCENLPVSARPNTWRYRGRKFVRRNRWFVATAAAALVAIVGFSIGMAVLAKQAKQEADNSRAVAEFLVSLFENAAPAQARGREITAREMLAAGAKRVRTELNGRPVVQGMLMFSMGNVYLDLGAYDHAGPLLQDAVKILREARGENDLDTASALAALAGWHDERGEFKQAEALHRQVLQIRTRATGRVHKDVASTLNNLGMAVYRQGRFAEAEQAHREALAIKRQLNDSTVRNSINNLAIALFRQEKYPEAEPLMKENVEQRIRELGERHPSTAASLHNYSFVLGRLGRYTEQADAAERALAIRLAVLGPDHPDTAYSYNSVSNVCLRRGDLARAIELARKNLAVRKSAQQPRSAEIGLAQQALAAALLEAGQLDEAATLIEESATLLANGSEAHKGSVEEQRAILLRARRQYGHALAELQKALATAGRKPDLVRLEAEILREMGNVPAALRSAKEAAAQSPGANDLVGALLCATGDRDNGIRLLQSAWDLKKQYQLATAPSLLKLAAEIATCKADQKRYMSSR